MKVKQNLKEEELKDQLEPDLKTENDEVGYQIIQKTKEK